MTAGQRVAYLTAVELSTGTILEVTEPVEEVDLRLRERWVSWEASPELMTLTRRDGRKIKVNVGHVVAIGPREGVEPIGFHPPASNGHHSS